MWPFSKKGGSGFTRFSTAEQVTEGIDGSGLTAIVTGASNGIGAETARVLSLRGVHVIMAVRNISAGTQVKETILKSFPGAKVDVMELDLSSFVSIRKFASEFNSRDIPLNILINNAGVICPRFSLSHDDVELQFATNHLGHFLLTELLLENMKETSRRNNVEGRIVNVSSEAHILSYKEGISFDNINDESKYSTWFAYGQSKLANILHANELSRRLTEEGVQVTANSLHPGGVKTNMAHNLSIVNFLVRTLGGLILKNVQQGAATTCYVALHPQVKGITGKYFSHCNISEPSAKSEDVQLAKRLWDFSLNVVS